MAASTAVNVAKLAAGLVKMVAALGAPFDVYRPTGVGPAIAPGNLVLVGTLAAFPRNYGYGTPIAPKLPQRYGIFDPTKVFAGDYLVSKDGANDTYYVGNTTPMEPILCYRCNRVLTVIEPQLSAIPPAAMPVGNIGALGNVLSGANTNTQTLLTAWPASALYSGRGPSTGSKLPADETSAQFTILMPPSMPVELQSEYMFLDDLGHRFVAIAAEQNEAGWRIITNQALQ